MSAVSNQKGFRVTGMYIREDLTPEERQKRRERSGSRKVTGAGRSPAVPHSQPLSTQSQSLSHLFSSPCFWFFRFSNPDCAMTARLNQLRIATYNCRGLNSGKCTIADLLQLHDVCLTLYQPMTHICVMSSLKPI